LEAVSFGHSFEQVLTEGRIGFVSEPGQDKQ
jgi:hypothetical protein